MSARHFFSGLLALSAVIVAFGCDDPSNDRTSQQIIGYWEMVRATRNNRETQTLAGTYFNFGPDGKMQTNFPSAPSDPTPFEIKENELVQKSAISFPYKIQQISDSSLTLALEMRGINFELEFRRGEAPVKTPIDSIGQEIPDSLQTDTVQ